MRIVAERAARKRGVRRTLEEAVHAAVLVGLEVEQDDVLELAGIEHLRHRVADVLVELVHPGVDERRPLVVDQELVELERRVRQLDGSTDPVDPVDDLVNLRHGGLSFSLA